MMKICQLQSIYVIHESSSWQVTIRVACECVFLFFFNSLRTEVIGSCQWMFASQHPFICYLCETSRVDWLALSSAHRINDLPTHCHRWLGEKMRSIWWQTMSCRGWLHLFFFRWIGNLTLTFLSTYCAILVWTFFLLIPVGHFQDEAVVNTHSFVLDRIISWKIDWDRLRKVMLSAHSPSRSATAVVVMRPWVTMRWSALLPH